MVTTVRYNYPAIVPVKEHTGELFHERDIKKQKRAYTKLTNARNGVGKTKKTRLDQRRSAILPLRRVCPTKQALPKCRRRSSRLRKQTNTGAGVRRSAKRTREGARAGSWCHHRRAERVRDASAPNLRTQPDAERRRAGCIGETRRLRAEAKVTTTETRARAHPACTERAILRSGSRRGLWNRRECFE